ncbi:osmotically inducible protein OsmC [Microbacterium sp. W4I4]|uniref:OsmC family protein n=1 Tax=Microbacterium sp. W4I4 TaxID=3042295 RepID=UPI00277DE0C9|nr:OsmC family protein [Microbacterium sp. W4I4]MDQ0614205.1 osmotically inducible protein OsmC [Microbacterium sp. W4I4]
MSARYRTEAINTEGGDGISRILDGMSVDVSSPLAADFDASASNPEQLLALAWVTCLNATAQAIVRGERRTAVRVEVELHAAEAGYEFHVDGYLSAEGLSDAGTADLVAAAHARCPVSKLIGGAATVHVHAEAYAGASA